jgi:alpha-glucosidase/alpha-D-xyloside xylohydrolase
MSSTFNRRQVLKGMAAASTAMLLPQVGAETTSGQDLELQIQVSNVSAYTLRFSLIPLRKGVPAPIPQNGSLVKPYWGPPAARFKPGQLPQNIRCGEFRVAASSSPLKFQITDKQGKAIQELIVDPDGTLSFESEHSPLLGLGEGGPQFDRRGSIDTMISGQGGYHLHTHGGRVPIPWIIGTAGWAIYIHQPFGTFDFSTSTCRFHPKGNGFPLDVFLVAASEPSVLLSEYARLTGLPELPPLWSFGYQQSHRTLANREEILEEAHAFREKTLPCDTLIYLGTGFCPSGWNTQNGSFVWNSKVFPDPKEIIQQLHRENFKVVLHSVILSDELRGTVRDACEVTRFDDTKASCHWDAHRKDFALGVDGWWPDEGDPLNIESRLVRNRLYWEGPQLDRPNERPFALHRNGYAGMQRYAAFLWSGDVYSTWKTLQLQVPIAINTSLTGIPYWGTDIGGFVPTKEFTAELYLRWFQFGAFCTLFRSHGRAWKLRLPWGWDTGETGPSEINNYDGAQLPPPDQLHNSQVEPICRKYLNLRYRLLPYLYSAVHESTRTGMPVMRALWLHYPDDPRAVERGDLYLWGRSLLVAPVTESGVKARNLYLPRGSWYDFWTGEKVEGGREITRGVDLETLPLYVKAGSLLPMGPMKQFASEQTSEPLSVRIFPGEDGSFLLYEDDGISFNHRAGDWMGIQMNWNDQQRRLFLRLADGSHMRAPHRRKIDLQLGEATRTIEFDGVPMSVTL